MTGSEVLKNLKRLNQVRRALRDLAIMWGPHFKEGVKIRPRSRTSR
jgi:hypothetical protein